MNLVECAKKAHSALRVMNLVECATLAAALRGQAEVHSALRAMNLVKKIRRSEWKRL